MKICGFDVLIRDEIRKGIGSLVYLDCCHKVVYQDSIVLPCDTPYKAGHLADRELPFFKALFMRAPYPPDAILVDGNGRLHPEKNGLACQVYQFVKSIPVVGVAKNFYKFPGVTEEGCQIFYQDENVARKILNGNSKNPVYVSVGGDITLNHACCLVKECSRTRIPEPIKIADKLTRLIKE